MYCSNAFRFKVTSSNQDSFNTFSSSNPFANSMILALSLVYLTMTLNSYAKIFYKQVRPLRELGVILPMECWAEVYTKYVIDEIYAIIFVE